MFWVSAWASSFLSIIFRAVISLGTNSLLGCAQLANIKIFERRMSCTWTSSKKSKPNLSRRMERQGRNSKMCPRSFTDYCLTLPGQIAPITDKCCFPRKKNVGVGSVLWKRHVIWKKGMLFQMKSSVGYVVLEWQFKIKILTDAITHDI